MTFVQALTKAKQRAKDRGEPVYIVDDTVDEGICLATEEDAQNFFHSEPILAIVHPHGWIE